MGFADQQLQIQVPYSPDDTFNALKAVMEKLPKVKVDSASPATRTVAAEIGMSLWSWGEISVFRLFQLKADLALLSTRHLRSGQTY